MLPLLLLLACGRGEIPLDAEAEPQDLRSAALSLDLGALSGQATVVAWPGSGAKAVQLDVSGLALAEVSVDGAPAAVVLEDGVAKIPVEDPDQPLEIVLAYTFEARAPATFDGWMPELGVSFVWPDSCGNLFPCDPSPVDGLTVSMELSGYEGSAVFPSTTWSDGPSYMPAVAVNDYATLELGATTAGTTLRAWYIDDEGGYEDAAFGTAHLRDAFDFLERTYGPYAFGPESGAVEVDWGADSTGGMEHHPYFHVGKDDFWNEETQVHEAAHGWFGDGVRLACWEDFVLSEGTVTYMAARALEQVDGPDLWPVYVQDYLEPVCTGAMENALVLPGGCVEDDFERSPLWSLATYMKGACFYEDVADLIGADVLDGAIAEFYQANLHRAATMRAMIDTIEAHADPSQTEAIEALVTDWLGTYDCPVDYASRCRAHGNPVARPAPPAQRSVVPMLSAEKTSQLFVNPSP